MTRKSFHRVKRFRTFDHTGDVGVFVYGASPSELFVHAAEALFHIMTRPPAIKEVIRRHISRTADGYETLLVAWLSEFLYLFDTASLLFRRFEILTLDSTKIDAIAWGEPYDARRHPITTVIKAVTYHDLKVVQDKGLWKTKIVFDI